MLPCRSAVMSLPRRFLTPILEHARALSAYHAIVANGCRFLTEIRIRFVFQHEGVQIQALTLDG